MFLDGKTNTARDICSNLSVAEALRTADPCQLGVAFDGRLRPVTALINEAMQIKGNDPNLDLYVVAIGPADDTGLGQVATSGSLYNAMNPQVLNNIFSIIAAQSGSDMCRVSEEPFTSSITGHEAGSLPGFPAPDGGHGYVTIRDSQGNVLPGDQGRLSVINDSATGKLMYRLPVEMGLAPEDYSFEAYIKYRGNDSIARTYRRLVSTNDPEGASLLHFSIPSDAVGDVYAMDTVFLDIAPEDPLCPTSPME
ncbi:MAG: hypothetical protein GFH27_549371n5 [Chloroflexi bacterium AL-W]|nr:hypothetical protein [Chloroflexi bacterium AL-N1]NOK70866.1 hypothetical protein [Chloroflexi bacterium AL-N10]NOK78535.1 hypothetical protein [Chloroflexi bacterium AL-N5]NOK85767.1 hypothetical protein [Chloroflexi bacterium AL-W]NOK92683.1 hypothetical protein [Chloroflexi bacterium AL-N15]